MLKSAGQSHANSQMVNLHAAYEFTCKLQHQNANSPENTVSIHFLHYLLGEFV